jgi:hypothetical protein
MPIPHKNSPIEEEFLQIVSALSLLPPNDPSRYETTDGFENPSCTNGDRASLAAAALDTFQKSCGMSEDVAIAAADLICDLLHLVHANMQNPNEVLHSAIQHFLCEAG